LTEFDKISAGLAELNRRFPPDLVYDVATTKGMKEAIAHRAAWRDPRLNVEKMRKVAKAPVLALGKDIDARASWLDEQLRAGEAPVDKQIKAHEAFIEAEKQAKINAEFARVQAIQDAIAEIHMGVMGAVGRSSEHIRAKLEALRAEVLDPLVFQEQMAQAVAARDAGIIKLETALRAQLFTEAEAAKIAAERAELEELRKAAAIQKAKDEVAAVEASRIERERIAAERKAANELQARLDAEAAAKRAADDAEAAEVRRQVQAKFDAELEAQREAFRHAQALADAALAEQQAKERAAAEADQRLRDAAPAMRDLIIEMRSELHQYTEGFTLLWGRVDRLIAEVE